ncbi:deoxyribose-phosphate aldolase [Estrella lausannensis]|uniref:deoxyribose-phosphate aldolase n=1 Tax=Estrella lausannensis TaxID=483423 RepID=UPI003B833299
MQPSALAPLIDHTLLKADATKAEIEALCKEALAYRFYSVCVLPVWVEDAVSFLRGSSVKVTTVIGFPLGGNLPLIKAKEAEKAVKEGAHDIDMVICLGKAKEHKFRYIKEEIEAVIKAAKPPCLKVILETCNFDPEEIRSLCTASKEGGADFIKTSTGFGKGGALVETIALLKECVGGQLGIKASGGIKNYSQASSLLEAGATRIGSSASVFLMKEAAEFRV